MFILLSSFFFFSGPEAKHAVSHSPGHSSLVGAGNEEPHSAGTATGRTGKGKRRAEQQGDCSDGF